MPSDKRLKDLEYNVFKKDMSNIPSGGLTETNDKGCLGLMATVVVFIIVVVCVIGFTQVGRNGPGLTCAAPGCRNHLKPSSNYCWLHSSNTNTRRSTYKDSSSGKSGGSGSVIGGSSSEVKEKRKKIWEGEGNAKGNKSGSSSSSSSSSSSGGSSIGN